MDPVLSFDRYMLGLYGVLDSIASVRRQDVVDREENGASNKRALASYCFETVRRFLVYL